jgi:hypothetical protein
MEKVDRIVELDIELDELTDEQLEKFGVEVISIVESPAIEENFYAFGEEEFETYDDYPEAARNNACRAVKYAEENGWGDCGTQVGKVRANQLCSGEKLSRDTIARMSAFRRQQENKDTPYGEGCGGLMWDAWGGDAGIDWAERKLKEIDEEMHHLSEEAQDAILAYCEANGEYISEDDVIINLNTKEFSTITTIIDAIRGLDILKRLSIPNIGEVEPEAYYRYTGPPAERRFCKAMVNLARAGKIFSQTEIDKMDGLNAEFSKKGQSSYSIFKYKGGKNCKHYWEKLSVFKNDTNQRVIIVGQAATPTQEKALTPWANLQFSLDDDKRIVTGPLIIPNKMILRRNEDGSPYYVFFSKDTIRKMAEKFFKLNKHNNTDIEHDWDITTKNTLIESWISESPYHDKAYKFGFALPAGTWYVSYKINNDETWADIKSGKLKGFSLAGNFLERLASEKLQQQTLSQIINVLSQIDE